MVNDVFFSTFLALYILCVSIRKVIMTSCDNFFLSNGCICMLMCNVFDLVPCIDFALPAQPPWPCDSPSRRVSTLPEHIGHNFSPPTAWTLVEGILILFQGDLAPIISFYVPLVKFKDTIFLSNTTPSRLKLDYCIDWKLAACACTLAGNLMDCSTNF